MLNRLKPKEKQHDIQGEGGREMKLDRNINGNQGRGKYALLLLRQLATFDSTETFGDNELAGPIRALEKAGVLDWGCEGSESEFFVIRLKDKYAADALAAYALAAQGDDPEYAREIAALAARASANNPHCKQPD